MFFLLAAVAVGYANREAIAGKAGELKTPKDTDSPELKNRQAIREYNALLDRTDPREPMESVCIKCIAVGKAKRRNDRHDLIRNVQSVAAKEDDLAKKKKILDTADRLGQDMERVEDAKLAQYTYTANDPAKQPEFLRQLRDQPPPGFKNASIDQVAKDFGVDKEKLEKLVSNPSNPTQKIMVFERDPEVLGQPPKYTVAFRGSTSDARDWNNNGRNEAGFEAPHQKNSARLGEFLAKGVDKQGKEVDSFISAAGHSKGGSEAQAFAAASGSKARVFNPAGFDPQKYAETSGVTPDQMHIDRTTVIVRDDKGKEIEAKTDPLYYAQHNGVSQYVMKKPVTNGPPRELAFIDPNLSVPSNEQNSTEAHSMLQVIEGLERDKKADEKALTEYAGSKP